MSSVSKSGGARKKEARDRRILAKARHEEREQAPVSEGIRRTAKRAGLEGQTEAPLAKELRENAERAHAAAEGLKEALGELKELREIVKAIELIFEGEGRGTDLTSNEILSEALVCAREDIDLLQDGAIQGCDGMHFRRAYSRIDLALKFAAYRSKFPPVAESAGGAS